MYIWDITYKKCSPSPPPNCSILLRVPMSRWRSIISRDSCREEHLPKPFSSYYGENDCGCNLQQKSQQVKDDDKEYPMHFMEKNVISVNHASVNWHFLLIKYWQKFHTSFTAYPWDVVQEILFQMMSFTLGVNCQQF